METLARVVYLLDRHRLDIPRAISPLLPYGEILQAVGKNGADAVTTDLKLPDGQLISLRKTGKKNGPGSIEELRLLLADLALGELEIRKDELGLSEYLKLSSLIHSFINNQNQLVTVDQVDLGSVELEKEDIPKFSSGFEPFDELFGGLYQGIMVILGKPGHGKTSVMLSMMESFRLNEAADSLWFFEIEIPSAMMMYKMRPIRGRTKFRVGKDLLFCGYHSMAEIAKMSQDEPNKERVIFIDGPDAMTGQAGPEKRFAIEHLMIDLVRMKEFNKLIVISSQVRRKDNQIDLESGAESWAKAWYSDMMVGIKPMGSTSKKKMNARVVKNRFGPNERQATFRYDYVDLSFEFEGIESDDW